MSFAQGLVAGAQVGQAFRQNLDRRRIQRQMAELGEQFAPQQVQGSIIQYSPRDDFVGPVDVPTARPVIGDDLDWEQYTQEAARRGLVPERQDATFYQVPFSEGLYSSQAQAVQRYAPDRMIAESHLLRQMGYHDEAQALFDQAQTMRGDPTAQVAQRLELIDTQLSSLDAARTRGQAMMSELRQAAGDQIAAQRLGITQEEATEQLQHLINRDNDYSERVAELLALQHNLSHPPSAQVDRNDVFSAMEILARDGISPTPDNIRQFLDDIAFGPVDPEVDPGAPPDVIEGEDTGGLDLEAFARWRESRRLPQSSEDRKVGQLPPLSEWQRQNPYADSPLIPGRDPLGFGAAIRDWFGRQIPAAPGAGRETPLGYAQGGLVQNPNAPEPMVGMSSRRRRSLMDRARERFGDELGQPRGLDRQSVRHPALHSPEPSPEVLVQAARERRAQPEPPARDIAWDQLGRLHDTPVDPGTAVHRAAQERRPLTPARDIAWDQLGRLHDTPVDPGTAVHRAAQERRALVGRPPVEYADDQYSLPPGADLEQIEGFIPDEVDSVDDLPDGVEIDDAAPAPARSDRRDDFVDTRSRDVLNAESIRQRYLAGEVPELTPGVRNVLREASLNEFMDDLYGREGVGTRVRGDRSTGPLGLTAVAIEDIVNQGGVAGLSADIDLGEWARAYRAGDEDAIRMAEEAARVYADLSYDRLLRGAYPTLDEAPSAVRLALVDAAYNMGAGAVNNFPNLPVAIRDRDWQRAAMETLDTAQTPGGQSLWGLARRRAEGYNEIAEELGFAPITRADVFMNGRITYFDDDGNSVLSYHPSGGRHRDSRGGRKIWVESLGMWVSIPGIPEIASRVPFMAQGGLVRDAVPHMARGGYMADRRAAVASMHSRPPITAPGPSMRERLADAGQALSESMGGISSEAPHVASHREPGSHGLLRERPRLTPDPRLPYAQYAGGGYVKDRARELGTRVHDYRGGGKVRGPGTETSDSIPAMLSDGEYVINAKAVREVGKDTLDRINARGLTR